MSQNLSSAAVLIGALRVRTLNDEKLQALAGVMRDYLKQYQHAKAFRKSMPILHIGII